MKTKKCTGLNKVLLVLGRRTGAQFIDYLFIHFCSPEISFMVSRV
jgi:hypothetical protein